MQCLYDGPLVNPEERKAKILEILSRGKAVRFTNGDVWKDVKEFNADERSDLTAFRRSPNSFVPYVCWNAAKYEISEVDI